MDAADAAAVAWTGPRGWEDAAVVDRTPKVPHNKLSDAGSASDLLEVVKQDEPYSRPCLHKQIVAAPGRPKTSYVGFGVRTIYRLLLRKRLARRATASPSSRARTHRAARERTASGPCQILLRRTSRTCPQPFAASSTSCTCSSTSGVARLSDGAYTTRVRRARRRLVESRVRLTGRLGRIAGWCCTRQRRPDEGRDDAGDAATARRRAVLQPAARLRRQPYAESLFRTLKYRPVPVRLRIPRARARLGRGFVPWYNHEHQHSGIGTLPPHDRSTRGRDVKTVGTTSRLRSRAHEGATQSAGRATCAHGSARESLSASRPRTHQPYAAG